MKNKEFRFKLGKNNTIEIQKFVSPNEGKSYWKFWYEIDLDRNKPVQVADTIVQLAQKTWVKKNLMFYVELMDFYLKKVSMIK